MDNMTKIGYTETMASIIDSGITVSLSGLKAFIPGLKGLSEIVSGWPVCREDGSIKEYGIWVKTIGDGVETITLKREDFLKIAVEKKSLYRLFTQVLYNAGKKDEEQGFVSSFSESPAGFYCYFWSDVKSRTLRTKANSELTPIESLSICPKEMWLTDKAIWEAFSEVHGESKKIDLGR